MSVPRYGAFWVCECGHPLYEHGRRKVPNAAKDEYTGCRVDRCRCERWEASDGSKWPDKPAKEMVA